MKCIKCGCDLKNHEKFCPACGSKAAAECPKCGREVGADAKFCGVCGASLSEKTEAEGIAVEAVIECEVKEIKEKVPVKDYVKGEQRTLDSFKKELVQLSENDENIKAAVRYLGTKFFEKHLFPILWDNESLITIQNIQSKLLFARYRREFVVVTNRRVIKFEKMQYFKPKMEICSLGSIKEIMADNPSNAVSGTFVGEKLRIVHQDGQINMRMVGKGAAFQLKDRILVERDGKGNVGYGNQDHEVYDDNSTPAVSGKANGKKKGAKKKIIIGLGIVIIVLGALTFLGSKETGAEMSQYIPLNRAEVMEFIKKNDMEEMVEDFLYNNDDLSITLNDNGNIDIMIIGTPKYSLYGMSVGKEFRLERDGKKLTEHNYGFIGEYEDKIVYGKMDGSDTPGGDRLIGITLDSSGLITKLEYMATGTQEIIDGENEASNSEFSLDTGNGAEEYVSPESNSRYLTDEEILGMSDYEKLAVMYEIAARHGATFLNVDDGEQLQDYFNSKTWYTPSIPVEEMEDSIFNTYELDNIIKISESIQGTLDTANQGYMILPESNSRFYNEQELSGLSKEQLRLARNEIYARRGRKFETEDLNQYFSSQPWYSGYLSAEEFDDSVLNGYEKANLDLIKKVEQGENNNNSSGQMSIDINNTYAEYVVSGGGDYITVNDEKYYSMYDLKEMPTGTKAYMLGFISMKQEISSQNTPFAYEYTIFTEDRASGTVLSNQDFDIQAYVLICGSVDEFDDYTGKLIFDNTDSFILPGENLLGVQ